MTENISGFEYKYLEPITGPLVAISIGEDPKNATLAIASAIHIFFYLGRHGVKWKVHHKSWSTCKLPHRANSVGGAWNQRTARLLSAHPSR